MNNLEAARVMSVVDHTLGELRYKASQPAVNEASNVFASLFRQKGARNGGPDLGLAQKRFRARDARTRPTLFTDTTES
jgi:hypothetical protein